MLAVLGVGASLLFGSVKGIVIVAAEQVQKSEGINTDLWGTVILVSILSAICIFSSTSLKETLKSMFSNTGEGKGTGDTDMDKIIGGAGYSYDSKQDIFYSNLNAWQRKMGYCRLYDESAAPMGMIIDCEPIYFEFDGRRWLIEFWKGQYDLTTGCEIGVYATNKQDLNIPGVFNGTFYYSVDDEDMLEISYVLMKNGKELFTRNGKHWWLTGFKLGEYSEPSELLMKISITLKDEAMRNVFVEGLKKTGYSGNEISITGNQVGVEFNIPRTPQPLTRIMETDWVIQRKNKLLCDKYQEITAPYNNFPDKMKAIQKQAPELYVMITHLGRSKLLVDINEKLKKYLN